MKSQVVKNENNKVTLEIEVTPEKFEEGVQKAYMKNRGKFNIQGFRKGKVPRKIIEARYGKGVFYEDAINIIFPEAYDKAIDENNIETIDRPEVDIKEFEDGEPVVFTAEVAVKPEVNLGEYKGIEVEKVEYNVTEEDVEEELKKMQERNARIIEAEDRPVQEGDTLTIDYQGFIGDEQFEGGTAENQTLDIGSKKFIPGFEEQLVGKSKGEEVEVNVKFPEEYHAEDLAGKDAVFKVKIHEIKEKELPVLDDEFAKDVSEFDTLEELKNDQRNKLEEQAEHKQKHETEDKVIEKIVEAAEVEIPEVMIDREIDYQVKDFEQRISMQGLNLEQYLQFTNSKIEDLKEQIKPNAEKAVKTDLVLEAIGKKENIEATEEELQEDMEKMAKQYNQDVKELKKRLRDADLDYFKVGIIKRKTVKFLVDNTKLI